MERAFSYFLYIFSTAFMDGIVICKFMTNHLKYKKNYGHGIFGYFIQKGQQCKRMKVGLSHGMCSYLFFSAIKAALYLYKYL